MSKTEKTRGRGFHTFKNSAETAAFAACMEDMILRAGGLDAASARSGVSRDQLSKYTHMRAVPSRVTMQKMLDTGVFIHDDHETLDDVIARQPWLGAEYRRAGREKRDKQALKMDNYEPAVNQEVSPEPVQVAPANLNLMDAILAEPGLSAKQRAQLAALVTMICNDVPVDVSVSPRSTR